MTMKSVIRVTALAAVVALSIATNVAAHPAGMAADHGHGAAGTPATGMMGSGMMGQGMMGQDMMRPGMMGMQRLRGARPYTEDELRRVLDGKLAHRGLSRLKIGEAKAGENGAFVFEIVTLDDSLALTVTMDSATGRVVTVE